jgi:hypothetical protein
MTLGATALYDWSVFSDWAQSVDGGVEAVTAETVASFLAAAPAAPSTQRRRVRSIRAALVAAGLPVDIPHRPPSTTVRTGEGWADTGRALEQLPTAHFPVGLRGRRDGWLLVLIGVLGLTRQQARAISSADVVLFPALTIAGQTVPRAERPGECPACAVHRWLRVAGPAARGWKSEVQRALNQPLDLGHDCQVGLDGTWREAQVLAPAIDRHGWADDSAPLSADSVSNIMLVRQRLSFLPERAVAWEDRPQGRYASATPAELGDAYDDVNVQLTELLARTAEILGDGTGLLDRLKSFGLDDED